MPKFKKAANLSPTGSTTCSLETTPAAKRREDGKSVVVKVDDRGPFVGGRIIDLSLGAAKKLDMVDEGVAQVKIEIVLVAAGFALVANSI